MLITTLIVLAAATPVATGCGPAAGRTTSQLAAADAAAGRHDYRAADAALDAALKTLGSGYAAPPANDDTGMHLVLADSQKRRGKLKLAAELKRRVLVERLQLCRRTSG